jgi:hypothetical protein
MKKTRPTVPDHIKAMMRLRSEPWHWLQMARQLRRSANVLWPVFEQEWLAWEERFERDPSREWDEAPRGSTVELLSALTVENLLKGLLVAAYPPAGRVVALRNVHPRLASHDLREIVAHLDASPISHVVADEHRWLLYVLEEAIMWAGRYPSPREIGQGFPIDEHGYFVQKFFLEYPDDYFAVFKLCDSLDHSLARVAKPIADRGLL